jgi:hypothetical protein
MHPFKLADGRSFNLTINVHAVRKVWDVLQVDMHKSQVAQDLMGPEQMFREVPRLLAVICDEQLIRAYPELADFPQAMLTKMDDMLEPAECITGAHKALCEEWADFCRRRGQPGIARILDAAPRVSAKALQIDSRDKPNLIEEWMDAVLEGKTGLNVEAWIKQRQTPGDSSTSTPENSASETSATSPGDSST